MTVISLAITITVNYVYRYCILIACFVCIIKIGGTYTKPLLLPPEVAIGGFGRIQVHMHLVYSNYYLRI